MLGSAGPARARAPPPSRPASERYPPPLPGETRRPVTQQQAWPNQARGAPRPRPPLPTACPMPGGQSRPGSRRRRARSLAADAPARLPARIWGSPRRGGRGGGPRGAAGLTACKPAAGWGEARAGHCRSPSPPPPACPVLALPDEDGHLGWVGNRGRASRPSPGRHAGGGLVETGSKPPLLRGRPGHPDPAKIGAGCLHINPPDPPQTGFRHLDFLKKTGAGESLPEKDPIKIGVSPSPQRTQACPVL